jgi:hypothetical protein
MGIMIDMALYEDGSSLLVKILVDSYALFEVRARIVE